MKLLIGSLVILFTLSLQAKECTYEFDLDKSLVQGTGFKFTEKKGVTGSFTKFSLNKVEKKKSIKELLDGLVVTVDLMSLETGDMLRDQNLREAFFSTVIGNAEAKVEVKKVTDKKIEAVLNLNGKSQPISFDYKLVKDTIEAKGSFDALQFALNDGIDGLKKRCGSLHTGTDGKSKTWTDFDISVKALTVKSCK